MEPLFTWPGCKVTRIPDMVFPAFSEYREPFAGSASVFFHLLPETAWLNDSDPNIVNVFKVASVEKTSRELFKRMMRPGKALTTKEEHDVLRGRVQAFTADKIPSIEDAFLFLLLIKRSFCGNPYKPGLYAYSCNNPRGWRSFRGYEAAPKLARSYKHLKGVKITCGDFADVISPPAQKKGAQVFLFIDPPYLLDPKKEKGNGFYKEYDGGIHERLHALLRKTKHKFLLTIEDCPLYRDLYSKWANVRDVHGKYSTRNSNKDVVELFITNY